MAKDEKKSKEQKKAERKERMDALKKSDPVKWAHELSWPDFQELKPTASWKDFCNHKIESAREYWKGRAGKPPKGELSDEEIDKRIKETEAKLAKLKAKRKK